jgi:hypothetical protein
MHRHELSSAAIVGTCLIGQGADNLQRASLELQKNAGQIMRVLCVLVWQTIHSACAISTSLVVLLVYNNGISKT